eukprot:7092371-Ditylum_brightwellii.AAC.1
MRTANHSPIKDGPDGNLRVVQKGTKKVKDGRAEEKKAKLHLANVKRNREKSHGKSMRRETEVDKMQEVIARVAAKRNEQASKNQTEVQFDRSLSSQWGFNVTKSEKDLRQQGTDNSLHSGHGSISSTAPHRRQKSQVSTDYSLHSGYGSCNESSSHRQHKSQA